MTSGKVKTIRYGDMVVIDRSSLPELHLPEDCRCIDDDMLAELKHRFLCERLAIKSVITNDAYRTPKIQLLGGDKVDRWVEKKDVGIRYTFDVTRSMYSKGNIGEKQRVVQFDCTDEIVVDLFAGIGYWSLIFARHTGAKLVHACDWNPAAIEALKRNVKLNKVADKVVIHEGDCRLQAPSGVAQRVYLGLIPSSLEFIPTACRALDLTGARKLARLHVHGNVDSGKSDPAVDSRARVEGARQRYASLVVDKVTEALVGLGHSPDSFTVDIEQIAFLKNYAPHVAHLCFDVRVCANTEQRQQQFL